MSLKRDYTKGPCKKLCGGPGGWQCQCCNPYFCSPRKMKVQARRRLRHVGKKVSLVD